MPRFASPLAALSGALLLLTAPAEAQVTRLSRPDATLREEFSSIRGVRELPGGLLLVSDYTDQRVLLVDLDKGTFAARVTEGAGPREARLPTRLVAIPGDSTLLVDLGNNRLLLLDPQGQVVRTLPADRPGALGIRGRDAAGAFYFAVPGWAEREAALPNDSVRLVRWNPKTDAITEVAVIQGDRMRSDIREPARTPRIPSLGFASQDAWLLGDGGVIRIVRAASYRIEVRAPGAAPAFGPSYAYAPRAVTAADREGFVRRFLTESPTSGKGPNGGMGFSEVPSEAEIAAMTKTTQFAERHPMFDAGRVVAAPGGGLWVGRPPEEGKPVLYDVFDAAGKRVTGVELPAGRRVMSIGRRGVYVVAESELGIEHLERYPLPN